MRPQHQSYVVAVYEPLRRLYGFIIVRTNQRLRSNEVAVNSDLVHPVLWHSLIERSTASADFKTTESRNRPVPNARINQRIYFGGIEVAYFPCFRMIAMYRSI